MRSKSANHFFHEIGVVFEQTLLANTSSESQEAETVEDWHFKTTHGRHLRIDVQRVLIVAQSVQNGLVLFSFVLNCNVCSSGRGFRIHFATLSLVPESTDSSDKERGLYDTDKFSSLGIFDFTVNDKQSSFDLILDIRDSIGNIVFSIRFDRLNKGHTLFSME